MSGFYFLDSGASSHVTGNLSLLSNIAHSSISFIRSAGGQVMPVSSQGFVTHIDTSGEIKDIYNVLFVPGISANLHNL